MDYDDDYNDENYNTKTKKNIDKKQDYQYDEEQENKIKMTELRKIKPIN